jgi:hypothetical protein
MSISAHSSFVHHAYLLFLAVYRNFILLHPPGAGRVSSAGGILPDVFLDLYRRAVYADAA